MPAHMPAHMPVWSVNALCLAINDHVAARFSPLTVQGEIASVTSSNKGHIYFSLQENTYHLPCVMFRQAAFYLPQPLVVGQTVQLKGRLSFYSQRTQVQMMVESVSVEDITSHQRSYQNELTQRRARLAADGLLDGARKRALPKYPFHLGLVTSLDGAALHDVNSVWQRRSPHIQVVLAAAQVQGNAAVSSLQEALSGLYRYHQHTQKLDAIVLVRGGGSEQDLQAFQDESLARCVAQSPVPVISGIGHESDSCLVDAVADIRAATPTAAAELSTPSTLDLQTQLRAWTQQAAWAWARYSQTQVHTLQRAAHRLQTSAGNQACVAQRIHLSHLQERWRLLDPISSSPLALGPDYAWVSNSQGEGLSDWIHSPKGAMLYLHSSCGKVRQVQVIS